MYAAAPAPAMAVSPAVAPAMVVHLDHPFAAVCWVCMVVLDSLGSPEGLALPGVGLREPLGALGFDEEAPQAAQPVPKAVRTACPCLA